LELTSEHRAISKRAPAKRAIHRQRAGAKTPPFIGNGARENAHSSATRERALIGHARETRTHRQRGAKRALIGARRAKLDAYRKGAGPRCSLTSPTSRPGAPWR